MSAPYDLPRPEDLQRLMGTPYAPSEQQWAAITAPLAPGVVIAGAGSGKTTLMAARVVYLVATGQVAPEEVLGLTFTTKAAAELTQRIRGALTGAGLLEAGLDEAGETVEALEPTVATYNAYAASLLTDHGLRIGFEPDTRVLADASRYQLAARVVQRYAGEVRLLSDDPATVITYLLSLDGAMSEHLVAAEAVLAHDAEARRGFEAARAEELAGKGRKTYLDDVDKALATLAKRTELLGLVAAYRRAKQELGLMDFSEQIELAARLAGEHPDVGAHERARFRVVLLDEYQDTSVAQARLLSSLFSGRLPETGRGHAVTAVGDPHQAIYGWRGASVSNILRFDESFPAADGAEVVTLPLSVSRRSRELVLDVANRVAEPLHAAAQGAVRPLDPAPGKEGGVVEVEVFETLAEELADLATQVQRSHDDGIAWHDIGVLTRDNAHAALVFDALTEADVPVEIVGLSGLLRLPEVAEVLSVLQLIQDVTANAALLTLLSGPRWAIGPRDLALLGRRSRELAQSGPVETEEAVEPTLAEELAASVTGSDPAEVAALSDALEDPGEAAYSDEARVRFALLAAELRALRHYSGEPLLDLVRRVVDLTGIDLELASSLSRSASARRDNLDLFVKAVADFWALDGDASLTSLLAYLQAEDEMGNGLAVAVPSESDSVKLLTVHRAKGLEWHTVFVTGVGQTRFPSTQRRPLWHTSPGQLPSLLRGDSDDLPHLEGHDRPAMIDVRGRVNAHDDLEELRLGYVAVTRAAERLRMTAHLWTPARKQPVGPSTLLRTVREVLERRGAPIGPWPETPDKSTPNPLLETATALPWPRPGTPEEVTRRREAAQRVLDARATLEDPEPVPEDLALLARLQEWDTELERLVAEARAERPDVIDVALPSSLSATALARLRDDPDAFARDLARPMPRQPSPAARFGTRFHAWVESRFGQLGLLDPDDLPGRGDLGIDDDDDLRELIARFTAGPFGERAPYALEAPFALVLDGQVVRGRIDAVYRDEDGFLLVDWKTNRAATADPLQLAIYRQAWAELHGIEPTQVRAAFHYVRTGETVEPEDLPDRQGLVAILGG